MKRLGIIFAMMIARATIALAQPAPDVVMLDELVAVYEPVPFDHRTHAAMAEMWQGCETCHHRTPTVATAAASQPAGLVSRAKTQANAANMPACKECHDVANQSADIRMPNLKGAYHRQCLNCHREWANENGCSACHREQKKGKAHDSRDPAPPPPPTVDDIVGRMHPPIPEPETRVYQARFTPAVGSSVLFRHKEHTARYGLKCSSCHHRDNCSAVTTRPPRRSRKSRCARGGLGRIRMDRAWVAISRIAAAIVTTTRVQRHHRRCSIIALPGSCSTAITAICVAVNAIRN
jgi:hypothetical protein